MKASLWMQRLRQLPFAWLIACGLAQAGDPPLTADTASSAYVRWSQLDVDPARMDRFVELGQDNLRASRREAGVRAFYWASDKDQPGRVRVLEVYADESAYKTHLASAHYQAFRDASRPLLKGYALFEAVPVMLGAKPQLPPPTAVVRMAELEIDPAQLDAYKAIVAEEIEASIRLEPGVFAIYAVALKERPNHIRFFEIYADEGAYLRHRDTPHFQKYLHATQGMIVTRRLMEAPPGSLAR
ncbi:MAG: antibiotic biosynthesis monooxygenase [Proteobacteria bacterium]|nr:antibiotic biosynthesis monooxygenase [Pseudomonadota bacterium]